MVKEMYRKFVADCKERLNQLKSWYTQEQADRQFAQKAKKLLQDTERYSSYPRQVTVMLTSVKNAVESSSQFNKIPASVKLLTLDVAYSAANRVIDTLQPFVSIQPLPSPVGLVFMLDRKFTTDANASEDMRSGGVEVRSHPVVAKSSQVLAAMSMEAIQDVAVVLGKQEDVKEAVVDILTTEIVNAITADVLKQISDIAVTREVWTASVDGTMLVPSIMRASALIAAKSRAGRGNAVIVPSSLIPVLWQYIDAVDQDTSSVGDYIKFVGVLSGFLAVYSSDHTTDIIVTYKSATSEIDTGLVFAPYILVNASFAIDHNSFVPTCKFNSRYGTTCDADQVVPASKGSYFAVISIEGDVNGSGN